MIKLASSHVITGTIGLEFTLGLGADPTLTKKPKKTFEVE